MKTHFIEKPELLSSYFVEPGKYDEMLSPTGEVKPHWESIWNNIEDLGVKQISSKQKELHDLLKQNGVTYNVYQDGKGSNRAWQLDPIPFVIDKKEWNDIEKGVKQRAVLLS
ncbi:MAG: hypothetical protein SNJ77_01745, partial [Cytophagales bacterium]